jgi:parvulin-like peptidyl-prolyl isomerase
MLPQSFTLSPASDIARLFGESFSIEIMKIEPGQWAGPIRSGYGLHLVLVSEQVDGRLPELDEVREIVEQEWSAAHKKELKESIYKKFREKYTVVFEQPTSGGNSLQAVSAAQAAQEKQQ